MKSLVFLRMICNPHT